VSNKEHYDICIVGVGACGGLLAKQLSQEGFSVIGLEAGPRYSPVKDYSNDEVEMLKLFWNEPRTYGGASPIHVNSGFGVGGGTQVWCAVADRFHAADFCIKSKDNVGVDWPIEYEDLEPYYEQVERDFGISGNAGESPWEKPRNQYPMPAIEWSWACKILANGVRKTGAIPLHGSLAIASTAYQGRDPCNKCGFCISGCISTAKSSTLNTYIPKAEALGTKVLAESFVYNISYDRKKNRVTGVEYLDADQRRHHISARIVILTAGAIETPRLLLLSTNGVFPNGLANSSGLIGKYFTAHYAINVYGIFNQKMNSYKGPPLGNLVVHDWYDTKQERDFVRGYTLESNIPQPFSYGIAGPTFWGGELKDMIKAYSYSAGWWILGEGLPDEDNTVTLDPKVKDHRDLPVGRCTYRWLENDEKSMDHAKRTAVSLLEAAGAKKTYVGATLAACPSGTTRMGANPKTSVVNPYCQSHDIPNLFIGDTSVFPTGGGVAGTLTAMAVASRAGEYITDEISRKNL